MSILNFPCFLEGTTAEQAIALSSEDIAYTKDLLFFLNRALQYCIMPTQGPCDVFYLSQGARREQLKAEIAVVEHYVKHMEDLSEKDFSALRREIEAVIQQMAPLKNTG